MAGHEIRKVVCLSTDGFDVTVLEFVRQAGWTPVTAHVGTLTGEPAGAADARIGLVCLREADRDLIEALERATPAWRHLELIAIVSPHVLDDERCREFVAVHCADYQTLPIAAERLAFALGHVSGMASLAHQVRDLSLRARSSQEIIGRSPSIVALRHDMTRIAAVDAPVIVTGESGTGKELVARGVHQLSSRREHPFVAVSCVALPPTLIHAELFGYERGAFTGAHRRKVGHLEAAHRGTIFLDEIGDLDPELQALLLRFLEQHTIRRVGGIDEIPLDVRVIAATHVDIEAAVRSGRFREDLYYRLNVLRVHMPPLRERREDIELLARAFMERFRNEHPGRLTGFCRQAIAAMEAYQWPGNVRELMNRVRRALVMAEGQEISVADLQLGEDGSERAVRDLEAARLQAEADAVMAALRQSGGHAQRAAEMLRVSRATLYRLLARHRIPHVDAEAPSQA